DSVFSLNMGCRGVMRILMEAVDRASIVIRNMKSAYERREAMCSAVVIRSESDKFPIGTRIRSNEDAGVVPSLQSDLRTFAAGRSNNETISYDTETSTVEFAFERINPPVQLFILGGGADAFPLAEAAFALGWKVNVCDHRPAFLTKERFGRVELIPLDRDSPPEWDVDELSAFVVMNHNYERDKAMLPGVLRSSAFYVGALGPRKRTQQILE